MEPAAYQEMAETESRHWWFVGRRAILRSVIEQMELPENPRILEIGSGTGGNLKMLSSFGKIAAMELDDGARELSIRRTAKQYDIRHGRCPDQIPFSGERFDLICLLDVLEHVEDDRATLAHVRELLSDRGHALITVPAYQWLWSEHDLYLHHKRRYSSRELRLKIAAAGLSIERLTYFNTVLLPMGIAARAFDRVVRRESSGKNIPIAAINSLLRIIFSSERHALRHLSLPFGMSLLAVLNKS